MITKIRHERRDIMLFGKSSDRDSVFRKTWILSNVSNGALCVVSTLVFLMALLLLFAIAHDNGMNMFIPAALIIAFYFISMQVRYIFLEKIDINEHIITIYTVSANSPNAEKIKYDNIVIQDVPDHVELLEIQAFKQDELIESFLVMA